MALLAGNLKTKLTLAGLGLMLALSPMMAQAQGKGGHGGPRASFEELDADGDGGITQAEMRAHGMARLTAADADSDGVLSRDELLARMTSGADARATRRVDRMLERHDTDKNGALSTTELAAIGEGREGRGFSRVDADGNGAISKAEFEAMAGKMRKRGSGN